MDICFSLAVASTVLLRVASPVTLAWEHSVEHFGIEEEWRATAAGLELTEVRTQGLGAGVHVPPDARLIDGWWRFTPGLSPRPRLELANSSFVSGYRVCDAIKRCKKPSDLARGQPLAMSVCTS